MGINQIEIRLQNFKSYADSDWIRLNGKIEITGENRIDGGSNGSGKSSILEALWVLVNQSKSDVKPSDLKRYIRKGAYDFSIDAKVTYDDKEYSIKSTSHSMQCDNAIRKGLTDLYYSFLLQGMPNSFANLNPKDRKEAISIDFDCDNLVERSTNNLNKGIEKVDAKKSAAVARTETAKEKLSDLEKLIFSKQNELKRVRDTLATLPVIHSDIDIGNVNSQQLRDERSIIEDEIHGLKNQQAELAGDLSLKKSNLIHERDAQIKKAMSDYNLHASGSIANRVKSATKEHNKALQLKYDSDKASAEATKQENLRLIDEKMVTLREMLSPGATLGIETTDQIISRISQFLDNLSAEMKKSDAISDFDKTKDDVDQLLKEIELQIKKLETQKKSIRANAVKKPKDENIGCYTPKNKPKRNLPAHFIEIALRMANQPLLKIRVRLFPMIRFMDGMSSYPCIILRMFHTLT